LVIIRFICFLADVSLKRQAEDGSGCDEENAKRVKMLEDEEHKRLVTYWRRVTFENVDRTWVYVKRLGKTVNFQMTNVPYLIERFVGFGTAGGAQCDLDKLETALEKCLKKVQSAKSDLQLATQS
jgi:hypothetical protein